MVLDEAIFLAVWRLGCLDKRTQSAESQDPNAFRPTLTDSLAFSEAFLLCNVIHSNVKKNRQKKYLAKK
jgi:hypothetical protein